MVKKNIVLLEDSEETVLLVKAALPDFNVYNAYSIEEFRECTLNGVWSDVNVFLLDLQLDDGHASEVFPLIEENYSRSKIIVLTSDSDISEKVRAFEGGAVDYLTKPFNPLELRARCKVHVAESRVSVVKVGNIKLDLNLNKLVIDIPELCREEFLTAKECDILKI